MRYDVEGRSLAVALTVDKPQLMVGEPAFATQEFVGFGISQRRSAR